MRTFVAFTLPDDVANQIVVWQQQWLPVNVHPEPASNLHMTLAFLGDTSDELVPQINQVLAGLDHTTVQIVGPHTYTEQEKLAFLEYSEQGGSEIWDQLNSSLYDLMGYEPQFRPWLPHTTVWRYAPENKPNLNPELPNLSFSPTAVTLYQSVRNPGGGATYQRVGKIQDQIREVAEQHKPEGGYGDTLWNPEKKTVLWVPADWTSIEEEEAAREAFLAIEGVEDVEGDAEQGLPYKREDDRYETTIKPLQLEEPWERIANILDPIQDSLDQRVFNGETPKPSIVNFIKRIYYKAFAQTFGIHPTQVPEYVKLYLTGSLTTYQYSDTSDCDISCIPDYERLQQDYGLDPEQVRKTLISLSLDHLDGTFLPGGSHPLQFFCVSQGIRAEDQFKPGLRSGYDLQTNTWIVPPERNRSHNIAVEFPDVFQRASDIADKMETMLDAGDTMRAIELWKQIHKKRQLDQRAGLGEWSEGNIDYKWLVHQGVVDRLRHELGLQIATHVKEAVEYDKMPHNPNDPNVRASYEALKNETLAQYNHLAQNGYNFEFYPDGQDPYPHGPRQALEDIHNNKHLYVYPTEAGFGSGESASDHPLLEDSGVRWNGQPVTHNDLFRAVHDVFGHAKEGVGFRHDGEENAWRQHSAMYSDLARPAMTSETRGQNSWVNFGPYGEQNQTADQTNTIYAEQKAGLLPDWVTNDGARDYIAKIAATTMYHVSPAIDRESVRTNGLNHEFGYQNVTPNPQWSGNYFWDTLDNAVGYAYLLLSWDTEDLEIQDTMSPWRYENLRKRQDPEGYAREIDPKWGQYDIWQVTLPTDIPLKEDPYFTVSPNAEEHREEWRHPKTGIPGAFVYDGPIPPENLRLVKVVRMSDEYGGQEPIGDAQGIFGKLAKVMHVLYDFEADRITLGSKTSDADTKIIGEYDESANSATLYEAEKQWINPTYFRRLWNYSFPHRPLAEVHFQAGEDKKKLRTVDHPHHERHL